MRRLAIAGAGIALFVDAAYLVIIASQPGDGALTLRVPFVAAFIAAMAVAAILGSVGPVQRCAPALFALSGVGLLAMAVIAMFSIGIAVLLAAVPILVVACGTAVDRQYRRAGVQASLGALVALVVFIVGIAGTEIPIVCSSHGSGSGSGPGLFRDPYHWTCTDGVLTVKPGFCTHGGATIDSSGRVVSTSSC